MALISIVIPVYNEQGNLHELLGRIFKMFEHYIVHEVEVLAVNDGSSDSSLSMLLALSNVHKELKVIDLSKNFGQQAALKAGYDYARGDAVISLDADLQNPPEMIPQMIEAWEKGYEVVVCKRKRGIQNSGFFKQVTSSFFYKVLDIMSDTDIDHNAPDFRLLDRMLVDTLSKMPEKDIFLRGVISWMGFKKIAIEYNHPKRLNGKSGYSTLKMFRLALSGLTSFSTKPLYLALYLGVTISFFSFIYMFYAVFKHYLGYTISGWSSLIIAISFLGGLQLFVLGIIGLYLGKLFMQSKQRPEYIIRKTSLSETSRT